MKTSFPDLKSRVRESLVQFLWDQWVSIGLGGSARVDIVPFIVDPEDLLLATTLFCRDDSRFIGEVLDWLVLNGKSISLQRLRNRHLSTRTGDLEILFGLANFLTTAGHPTWKTVENWKRKDDPSKVGPVDFSDVDLRSRSRRPDVREQEATFLFKMRALFGVNARAEVLTWLIVHGTGYAAEIAARTDWYSRSVETILHDLERSGEVFSGSTKKRQRHYHLDREKWRRFLITDLSTPLRWFDQGYFYLGCRHIVDTLDALTALKNPSPRLQSITIRERIGPLSMAMEKAGKPLWFAPHEPLGGEDLVARFTEGIDDVLETLNGWREGLVQ